MQDKKVESFHLTLGEVAWQYTRMPDNNSVIFYHYTTHVGLEGILRSAGFRATYRMRMSDTGEFVYAKRIIYEALDEVERCKCFPRVAQSLVEYTRINLENFLKNSPEYSSSYCACLTYEQDHLKQWEAYAEGGRGFAIGFDLQKFLNGKVGNVKRGDPFIFCAPITYDKINQLDLVRRLMNAGISDLQRFRDNVSNQGADLTALRDRITKEIVVYLLVLINFLKAPDYRSEGEIRLMFDPNDGTLAARNIQYYKRNKESIPFIFIDLRIPITNLLPLVEIKIGPKASFAKEKVLLEDLLIELGYSRSGLDGPHITHSEIAAD